MIFLNKKRIELVLQISKSFFLVSRFKLFTMQFEELLQRQGLWEVADDELRDSLRLSICEVLLPAYRSFILRFGYVPFYLQLNWLF